MISEESYQNLCKAFIPFQNDVLLAVVGATLGKTALVPVGFGKFHIQRSVAIFRPSADMESKWLNFVFQSQRFQQLLWEYAGYSAQPGIYLGTLANFRIPLAPKGQQIKIISFLENETTKIDALISETQNSIALLKEHRAALISAAVTGKIDVREVA
jgi:type I restriction enzyme, S subunit